MLPIIRVVQLTWGVSVRWADVIGGVTIISSRTGV